ncbi:MAG: hypothetical protein Q9222_007034 [Ikaeria aurantiellina]
MLARTYWAVPRCLNIPDYHIPQEPTSVNEEPGGTNGTILRWSVYNVSIPAEATNTTSCRLTAHGVEIHRPEEVASVYASWNKLNGQLAILDDTGEAQDISQCIDFTFVASLYALNPSRDGMRQADINYNASAMAMVCKSDYFSGFAQISAWANGSILSVEIPEEPQPSIMQTDSLDINTFEESISNDHYSSQVPLSSDALHTFVDVNAVTMGSVIRAYLPMGDRIDSIGLEESITKAYKLVSALNFAVLLRNEIDSGLQNSKLTSNVTTVTRRANYTAVAISTPFAIISEVLLTLLTITAFFNLISYTRRKTLLRSDPESLAALFALMTAHFRNFAALGSTNVNIDSMAAPELKQITADLKCHISRPGACPVFKLNSTARRPNREPSKPCTPRPFYFTPAGLLLSYATLLVCLAGCALALAFAQLRHFTYLAETNSLKSQVLWQFTPPLVATLIGAVWTVVHRDLCVSEPWIHLSLGAPASTSLSVNYASRTPYAVLFNASKRHHVFLSFISFVGVTTSILNIVMGGLFSQASSIVSTPIVLSNIYGASALPASAAWNSTDWDMSTALELVRTNISDGTPVPPWSTREMFFLPVHIDPSDSRISMSRYNISTTGIGASLEYKSAGASEGGKNLAFGLNISGSDPGAFTLNHYSEGSFGLRQVPNPNLGLGGVTGPVQEAPDDDCYLVYRKELPPGPATIFMSLTATNLRAHKCSPYLAVLNRVYDISHNTILGVVCWPQIHMYTTSIAVDANKQVQKYDILSVLDKPRSPLSNVQEHVRFFMDMVLSESDLHQSRGYHGTRIGRYDWPGLLTARARNLTHPDGSQDADILATAANQTFAQTFASFWALYSDRFLTKAPNPDKFEGQVSYQLARMVPSIPAFTVTFLLLALYLIAATVVSVKRRKQSTPRVPNSLGTIMPWIIHSRIFRDFVGTAHLSSSLRDAFLRSLKKEYRFGWFRDEQGVVRLGVEESRYVTKAWVPGERRPGVSEVPLPRAE